MNITSKEATTKSVKIRLEFDSNDSYWTYEALWVDNKEELFDIFDECGNELDHRDLKHGDLHKEILDWMFFAPSVTSDTGYEQLTKNIKLY